MAVSVPKSTRTYHANIDERNHSMPYKQVFWRDFEVYHCPGMAILNFQRLPEMKPMGITLGDLMHIDEDCNTTMYEGMRATMNKYVRNWVEILVGRSWWTCAALDVYVRLGEMYEDQQPEEAHFLLMSSHFEDDRIFPDPGQWWYLTV